MKNNTKIDEVIQFIKNQIQKGIYVAGQRLPAERDMASQLKVSRATIRTSLLRLQSENLIDIVPRSGIFIRSAPPKVIMGDSSLPLNHGQELQRVGSFIHSMRNQGRDVLVRYLEPSAIISAGDDIGDKLGIETTTSVLKRHRVQLVDRVPYRMLEGYYLASLMGELVGQEDHKIPLFKWLWENKKFKANRTVERLFCRMPTEIEASTLNIARSQPIVEMHRWIWGSYQNQQEKIPFEFSRIVCNSSLHEFQYTYEIHEEARK